MCVCVCVCVCVRSRVRVYKLLPYERMCVCVCMRMRLRLCAHTHMCVGMVCVCVPETSCKRVKSLPAPQDDELTHRSEELVALHRYNDGWCKVQNERGQTGNVPANYIGAPPVSHPRQK